MAEKLGNWIFVNRGSWAWRRFNVAGSVDELYSARHFLTLLECLTDAKRHGYSPPWPHERTSQSGVDARFKPDRFERRLRLVVK